jgi:hypothetical protein
MKNSFDKALEALYEQIQYRKQSQSLLNEGGSGEIAHTITAKVVKVLNASRINKDANEEFERTILQVEHGLPRAIAHALDQFPHAPSFVYIKKTLAGAFDKLPAFSRYDTEALDLVNPLVIIVPVGERLYRFGDIHTRYVALSGRIWDLKAPRMDILRDMRFTQHFIDEEDIQIDEADGLVKSIVFQREEFVKQS